jgi:hypothetical protein
MPLLLLLCPAEYMLARILQSDCSNIKLAGKLTGTPKDCREAAKQ